MTALRVGFLGDSYRKRSFTRRYQHYFRNPKLAGGLLLFLSRSNFLCVFFCMYISSFSQWLCNEKKSITVRYIRSDTIDILTSGTENRGKGNSAKGKEEQKPVTTVALDRVCVRVWRRHVWLMYMYTPPETCVAMQRKLRNTTLLCRSGLFSRSCTCSLSRHEHNERPLIVLVCLIISSFVWT